MRYERVNCVLQRDHRRISRQRRSSGGQTLDFCAFSLAISIGVALRGNQHVELTFGVGRQARRTGELREAFPRLTELREAFLRLTELRQQRNDAPHALEPAALFGQGSNLPLHGSQFGRGRDVSGLRLLPGAWWYRALLGFALCLAPDISGIG